MADENEMGGVELTATQLDAQRARHLLDRALALSERGDLAGAIVTCRQSLALSPHSSQGWSMLGLLHERDGDLHGAIEAYEKALELSPSSMLERESLQRLRGQVGAAPRPAPRFNFTGNANADGTVAANGRPPLPPTGGRPNVPPDLPVTEKSSFFGKGTFYFRSLPLLVAVIACLFFLIVTQRIAQNRRDAAAPPATAVVATPQTVSPTPDANGASAPADANAVSPAPAATPPGTVSPGTTSPQAVAPAVNPAANAPSAQTSPVPVASAPQRVAPQPQSHPRVAPHVVPHAAPPAAMPVLPTPRITLPPDRSAAPADNGGAADDTGNGGGPVDVGNSKNGQYIPINPPSFPNPSSHPRGSRAPGNGKTPLA